MEDVLARLNDLPPAPVYALLATGALIENLLPVVPADTFIVAGGFLAGVGPLDPLVVFLAVWGFNVGGALAVYVAGRRCGPAFFEKGRGRRWVSERQMARLASFYERWGFAAIFLARFLPGFRAVVPVFAGVTGQPPVKVAPPLLAASAVWYGALVRAGYLAGDNLDAVAATLRRTNQGLLIAAAAVAVALAVWWRRVRRTSADDPDGNHVG